MSAGKPPIIAEKFTLLRKLGAGGMAEVFLAKQASEGNFEKLVVIKRILPQLASGPSNGDFVAMFLDEARLASDLRHPNIVTVMDVGKTGETYYIVMEFLHGQDVRKIQRKNAAWREEIPLAHCCQVVIDAAAGLHYAHNKLDLDGKPLHIVHRDVSPQNILVTYEGSTKIVDFGIAKAASQTTQTMTGVLKGKYTYMSPEQATGEAIDGRTDQFALGIVLWELLTMRRLFKRDTELLTLEAILHGQIPRPSRFRPDLPQSIDDIVVKALMHKREHRFASCEEMAFALEDALSKESVVHSSSRLSQFMRRLFADTLAEEATLGLVNPDGAFSRNMPPFTPLASASAKSPEEAFEKAVARSAGSATTAEGRRARSRDESSPSPPLEKSAEHKSELPQRAIPEPSPALPVVHSDAIGSGAANGFQEKPSLVPQPSISRARTIAREPVRAGHVAGARSTVAITVVAGIAAAAFVLFFYIGMKAWMARGPATLIIRSEPKSAAVTFDDKPTGQVTPALLKDVEAGTPHKIRLELAGRAPVHEIVTIDKRGETLEVTIEIP